MKQRGWLGGVAFYQRKWCLFQSEEWESKKKKIIKKRGVSDANGYCRKEGQRGK